MGQRLQLQAILVSLFDSPETANVYFQPPANVQMKYPCIRYERDYSVTKFADNKPYKRDKRYLVTVIDLDPDSPLPEKVSALPACTFDRHFVAGQLNHDVYKLFF